MDKEQISFASASFVRFGRITKRAVFLDEMDRNLPWKDLCVMVRPHYRTGEGRATDLARSCK